MEGLLERLREQNAGLDIKPVSHADFAVYGELVEDGSIPELVAYLRGNTPVEDGVRYVPGDAGAEALPVCACLERKCFGGLPVQVGWCNGTNTRLNALEWHNSGEVDVAAAPAVLLLATLWDRADGCVHTSKVRGFLLEAGQAVLLYATTLHFAPCAVDAEGFRMGIVLPRGTNLPLDGRRPEDGALWMQNKWLLAHAGAAHLVERGAMVGLTGPLLEVKR